MKIRNIVLFLEVLTCFVEWHESSNKICYDKHGDNMKDNILIDDVVRSVDDLLLNLEVYYTIKNINRID